MNSKLCVFACLEAQWCLTVCDLMDCSFLGGASGKESACQCRRHKRRKRCRFDPWVGKIPWRRAWQPISVFLPGKFCWQRSLVGYSPWGCRVRHNWAPKHTHKYLFVRETEQCSGKNMHPRTWSSGTQAFALVSWVTLDVGISHQTPCSYFLVCMRMNDCPTLFSRLL